MATFVQAEVVRVLVADRENLFRAGLARLLAEDDGLRVVGEAAGAEAALGVLADTRPDVVVMDVEPVVQGHLDLVERILMGWPGVEVLILTGVASDDHVIASLRAGAAGYLLKDSDAGAVTYGIRAVMAGERVLSPRVADRVLQLLTGQPAGGDDHDGLTARELEVLKLVAAGTAYKQVGRLLHISHKTVRTHICHIYDKLAIYDRAEVVRYALRKGLVEL
jgi:DNA-binding NarL/FixJ family response regulator